MPMYLPPISRRQFLAGSVAAGVGMLAGGRLLEARSQTAAPNPVPTSPRLLAQPIATSFDQNRLALLSDTHINADPGRTFWGTNMAANLRQVCREVLGLGGLPAAVLINGDLAHLKGRAGDYAAAVSLLEPLRDAGLWIHVAMGNHDSREHFRAALGTNEPTSSSSPSSASLASERLVTLLEFPHANVLMLDSLNVTNAARGMLGTGQLTWLANTLDARRDKPALVFVHHHPELRFSVKPSGISDTAALLGVLSSRRQAKALFYGHTHKWSHTRTPDGLHLVNLPATAYTLSPGQPNGWVDANLESGGAALQLHSINPAHPLSGQRVRLAWRA
jgi:3',5'-cyclic AMP phosphodiesterase CpdA